MNKKATALALTGIMFLTACSQIKEEHTEPLALGTEIVTGTPNEQASTEFASEENVIEEKEIRDFTQTITVNSKAEFLKVLGEARDELVTKFELKIPQYSDSEYDIQNFEKGKYSLSSQGKQWGSTAYMTYTFDYSDSYMICRAIEVPRLESRLSEQQLDAIAKLKEIQSQLISEDMSDYQKELAIHDYIIKNFSYDSGAAAMTFIPDRAISITDFLSSHKGVCEAYAYAFKALCNLSGIECSVITGKLNDVGHAWNIVKIDGSLYHIDVTSDDPVPDIPDHSFYSYFNLTDEQIAKTHSLEGKTYGCTDTRYNYFVYNGLVINSGSDLKTHLENAVFAGKTSVMFKANGYLLNDDDILAALHNKGFTSYTIIGDTSNPFGDFEIQLSK